MVTHPHLVRIVGHDVLHADVKDVGERHAWPQVLLGDVRIVRGAIGSFNPDGRAHLADALPGVDEEEMGRTLRPLAPRVVIRQYVELEVSLLVIEAGRAPKFAGRDQVVIQDITSGLLHASDCMLDLLETGVDVASGPELRVGACGGRVGNAKEALLVRAVRRRATRAVETHIFDPNGEFAGGDGGLGVMERRLPCPTASVDASHREERDNVRTGEQHLGRGTQAGVGRDGFRTLRPPTRHLGAVRLKSLGCRICQPPHPLLCLDTSHDGREQSSV